MNKNPLIFAEGLRHEKFKFLTWIRQLLRAIIFLLDYKRSSIYHYASKNTSEEAIFAVIATANQINRLSSLSGKKYTDILTTETKYINNDFKLVSIIRPKRIYLLRDLLKSFFTCSQRGGKFNGQSKELFAGVSYDFLNDQNFFSRLCLNYIDNKKTSVYQHGMVRLPEYYFPVNCFRFYGFEIIDKKKLQGSKQIPIKFVPAISSTKISLSTDNVFIATHSVFRDAQLIIYGAILSKKIICKPHPAAKFKWLYSFLKKVIDFELCDEVEYGFKNSGEFWTFYSSLAIDARCNGLLVKGFRGVDPKPWFILTCEKCNNSVDGFRAGIGSRLIL